MNNQVKGKMRAIDTRTIDTRTAETMKCKCGDSVQEVKVRRLPASTGNYGGTFRAVAYCCGSCGVILGVESDPLERDAQMNQMKLDLGAAVKLLDQVNRKLTKPIPS